MTAREDLFREVGSQRAEDLSKEELMNAIDSKMGGKATKKSDTKSFLVHCYKKLFEDSASPDKGSSSATTPREGIVEGEVRGNTVQILFSDGHAIAVADSFKGQFGFARTYVAKSVNPKTVVKVDGKIVYSPKGYPVHRKKRSHLPPEDVSALMEATM